jgi:hypothetical protein
MATFGAIAQGLGGLGEATGRARTGAFDIRSRMLQDWVQLQHLRLQQLQQQYQQALQAWSPYSVTKPDGSMEQGYYNVLTGERRQAAAGTSPEMLKERYGRELEQMRESGRMAVEKQRESGLKELEAQKESSRKELEQLKSKLKPKKSSAAQQGLTANEKRQFDIATSRLRLQLQRMRSQMAANPGLAADSNFMKAMEDIEGQIDQIAQQIISGRKQAEPLPSHRTSGKVQTYNPQTKRLE